MRKSWAIFCVACLATIVQAEETDRIVLYPALGDIRGALVEGRVIEEHRSSKPRVSDSWWTNLRRSIRALINDEREGAAVVIEVAGHVYHVETDEEGYFAQALDSPLVPGWQTVEARVGEHRARGALLVVPNQNTLGVISDIDDTILVSEVASKRRLLENTLLKNPLQRQAVAGTATFFQALLARNPQSDTAPVIYLSASPRQIEASIQTFLDENGFPRGVLITKKVTNDRTGDPLVDQFTYKAAKLEAILDRLPEVRFVLVGDDGERDPEIYDAIRSKHPRRVEAVYIRHVNSDPKRRRFSDQQDLGLALSNIKK